VPIDALLLVRALYLAAYLWVAVVDLRSRRIPNRVTYPLLAIALVARPDGIGLVPLANVAVAAVVALVFTAMVWRGWMGMGDAKLAALIALATGPALGIIALWLAFLIGAVVGVALMAAKRLGRREPLPFGPFLALAGALSVLVPDALLSLSPFRSLFS
jgi:prepilin signal peptidase PulO-like enzyme (type II secretory pathway)